MAINQGHRQALSKVEARWAILLCFIFHSKKNKGMCGNYVEAPASRPPPGDVPVISSNISADYLMKFHDIFAGYAHR